jgi:flagellar hook-associated protein 1 FlgK
MSTLSIGVTGLNAAMVGLTTTSHNIANQSTPGYNRQVIVQEANIPVLTGSGFLGQGANVETVKRVYDQFLSRQVLSAQTGAAEMDSYLKQISQIDSVLADATSGLSSALTGFFSGVQTVAANPSSIPARQSMLSTAQSLVARFQSLNQRLTEIRDGINSQISSEVSSITNLASQIADINQRIIVAQAGSQTQQPNDLLDQRDQMIADLNKAVRVTTVNQSDGTINVFFGNGQPLVVGVDSFALSAVADAADPERLVVVMQAPGGTTVQVPESQIAGGNLGGLIGFRSESLDSAQNALGRVAIALTQTFNNQHQLGQDLTGALGGDFFNVSAPTVYANSFNSVPVLPATAASVTASFSTTAAANLTTSDYQLTYTGIGVTPYTLTRMSDNTSWTGATAAAVAATANQGFDLAMVGTIAVGDSFKIEPTRAGAGSIEVAITDARNIAAAAPMRTATALTNTGTGKIDAGTTVDTTNAAFATPGVLTPPILIRFNTANTYTIYDNTNPLAPVSLEGPIAYVAGDDVFPTPGALDYGYRIKLSGAPAAGDSFTVGRNSAGVADNRNAVALAALQTANTMVGGTASYQAAYSQLVSEVGNKTREVQSIGEAQQTLADAAVAAQQSMSGVNLDEEAANLLRYQQAYQASAKVIEIAGKLFDQLLTLG